MNDDGIIRLYFRRDPDAIAQTKLKYGGYCFTVAQNLLGSAEDAEECVNDTFLGVWNAIPPQKPTHFKLFLAKITRNLAFNRYERSTARKRGGGQLPLVLEELDQCIAGGTEPEQVTEARELQASIRRFVEGLSSRERTLFVKRYFFTMPVAEIAKEVGMTPNHTSVALSRIRGRLRDHLIKEEFLNG